MGRTLRLLRRLRTSAPFAAAALAGATVALAVEWIYLSGRMIWESPGAAAPHAPNREEVAIFGLTIVLLGLLSLAIFRRGQRAVAQRDAEIARVNWRLDLALDASEVGFWDVDLETDALTWDERARAHFGVPQRDGYFSEVDWAGAIHPDDRSRALATANAAVAAGERFVSDYRVVWPDGQIRHLRDMAAFYVAADGKRRLSGLVWDVTADKAREAELELRRHDAEAATVAKSNFLAAMSHEIRTPLAGVIGMLDLMLDEPLPAKQAERARVASASAHGLLQILNEVLDFSKLQADAVELTPMPVEPRALIGEVTALMAARSGQKGLALTAEIDAAVPEWLSVDPVRLRQILTNLVSNAIAFTDHGAVVVRAGFSEPAGGGLLAIEVEDTGVGVAEADRERIFERFVQADATVGRRAGGTGLGLAIARRLVERMGGTIAVGPAAGGGSVFRFTVATGPAAPADAPAPADPVAKVPPLKVLVAEDNPTNQYLVEALLAADGHTVTVVEDGPTAVAEARTGRFDVVLMDIQMPGMDGLAAARAIRRLKGAPGSVPILALTAGVAPGDREQYAAAGMDDHLAKPIDRDALARALARAATGDLRPAFRAEGAA